jgi:DNA-binding MarR family transcriptional regulator
VKPTTADITHMTSALISVVSGIRRASERGGAATLTILSAVAARPGIRPSDVASQLAVNQSSITRQLQKLQRTGSITLTADPSDRRSCSIALTRSGEKELRRLTSIGLGRFALFVKGWDASEVKTFTRLLAKFEKSKSAVNAKSAISNAKDWRNSR